MEVPLIKDRKNVVGTSTSVNALAETWLIDWQYDSELQRNIFKEVDIALNPRYTWSSLPSCPSNAYDIWNVASHEFGHMVGLNDQYTGAEDTMYGWAFLGETKKRDITNDDATGARNVYPEPIPPSNLSASAVSSSQINLSWWDNSKIESGLQISRDGTIIKALPANTRSYSDTGLSAATTYKYKVRAYRTVGANTHYSVWSNEAQATTQGGGGGCKNSKVSLILSESEGVLLEGLEKRLITSPEGSVGRSYWESQEELMALFRMNPKLRDKTKDLICHFTQDIENVINTQKTRILTKTDFEILDEWLVEISKYASPELQTIVSSKSFYNYLAPDSYG